ncbi:adenylate/guanylate cyclase domain-containing protein [Labrys miyagiensis]|uniref:Adenylate/guanylate cyclase domain-containing protein n=1 Tax=Labrys miyagiensis TaxID=346912 RepID=A0ABQ6CB73_9HYPH|nr:adenylate/guanylate cyclase domain-containing protein [Labrys miyagiensis]GLS17521.1 adenylate/guanylate cyclase domain-containing protein [Labrys miyagiensis]
MSDTDTAPGRIALRLPRERELRLWAGVVLFAFVTTHLLNHALGIFGVGVLEAVQAWRIWVWQSPVGTGLLYGAFLVHALLALKRLTTRRISRMPLEDLVQIALGLAIPYFLIGHVLGTRITAYYGYSESYTEVLARIWQGDQFKQILLLLCAWTHGCIGIGQTLRSRKFYPRWRDLLILSTGMLPTLALAGFFAAGREIAAIGYTPAPLKVNDTIALLALGQRLLLGFAGLLALVALVMFLRVLLRLRSGSITIRYVGHGTFKIPRGTTVLEASRANGIPHPAQCGGRGRCSTCRVAITSDPSALSSPHIAERAMLERISAPGNVRLACQLRPDHDLSVQILLPIVPTGMRGRSGDDLYRWGAEREITALFVDIRAFNSMTRLQVPYDIVLLMNRFVQEMTQAAEAHGGRVDAFAADGLIAIFGLDDDKGQGAYNAVRAAQDMLKSVEELNTEFGAALAMPLRVGIGIHSGNAIIARVGDTQRGMRLVALGETVTIAGRLEAATKDHLTDCLISEEAVQRSGLTLRRQNGKNLHIVGRDKPIALYTLDEAAVPAE